MQGRIEEENGEYISLQRGGKGEYISMQSKRRPRLEEKAEWMIKKSERRGKRMAISSF